MVSIQQVHAIYKVIKSELDSFYSSLIQKIDESILKLSEEAIERQHDNPSISMIKFDPDTKQLVAVLNDTIFENKIRELEEEKKALIEEWKDKQDRLEIWKNLTIISKDTILDNIELPQDLERFLMLAVEHLEGGSS